MLKFPRSIVRSVSEQENVSNANVSAAPIPPDAIAETAGKKANLEGVFPKAGLLDGLGIVSQLNTSGLIGV